MNWTALGAIADLFGAIAVVASLIYVARQIRLNTTAIRSSTLQSISDQANQLNVAMFTDEQMPRLVAAMFEEDIDRQGVSPEDRWRLSLAVMAGLRRVENLYLQVKAGVLDESAFRMVGLAFYRTRFSRQTWDALKAFFDPDFVDYLDNILTAEEYGARQANHRTNAER